MDLLLDTHVLIWWDSKDRRLARKIQDILSDPENNIFVSAASVWEIAIKRRSAKLQFSTGIETLITGNGFRDLAISRHHGCAAGMLDWEHTDPFDRMLVTQAMAEGLTLVHADRQIRAFPHVAQLWAR